MRIVSAGDFDSGLYFADGDGRDVKVFGRYVSDPVQDRLVRPVFAQLGDDVGIEEIHGPIRNAEPRGGGGPAVEG